jgi:hypothetical protein
LKKLIIAAAAVILSAAVCISVDFMTHYALVLSDLSTGEQYASYPIKIGDEFSITFTHSVNKTPVTDYYKITSINAIDNIACKYYGFGAGVQTELNEGETLRYEDGAMIIENINKRFETLIYAIKQNSTHHLSINGEDIFLPELSDKPMKIVFKVRHCLSKR